MARKLGPGGIYPDSAFMLVGDDNERLRFDTSGLGPDEILTIDVANQHFLPIFNVKNREYGAKGDGVTDDAAAINAAVTACQSAGGGIVYIPAGTYMVGTTIAPVSRGVYIHGSGIGSTILKQKSTASGIGGIIIFDSGDECGVFDLTVDGNRSDQSSQVKSNNGISTQDVGRVHIERVESMNNDGYGIGIIGAGLSDRHDIVIRDCFLHNNDTDGIDIKGGSDAGADPYGYSRVYLENIYSYDNGPSASVGSQSNGIDLRGVYVTANNIYAFGNSDPGLSIVGPATDDSGIRYMNLSNIYTFNNGDQSGGGSAAGIDLSHGAYEAEGSSEFHLVNCHSEGNQYGLRIQGAHVTASGCSFSNNRAAGVEHDYEIIGEKGSSYLVGCQIRNNDINASSDGVRTSNCDTVTLIGCEIEGSARYGVRISAGCKATLIGCDIHDNVTGIRMESTDQAYALIGNRIHDNTTGMSYGSAIAGYVDNNIFTDNTTNISGSPTAPSVSSASALALPKTTDYFHVTGTTTITSINAASTYPGRVVTLVFDSALCHVTDGSNLKLNGSFLSAADDTLTLVCDGTNWYEVGRGSPVSVNAESIGTAAVTAHSTTAAGIMSLRRSRNTTTGSHTILNSGDVMGEIRFQGSDGAAYQYGAAIRAEVDGTPGTGDMPTRIVIGISHDGAAATTDQVLMGNDGGLSLKDGITAPATRSGWATFYVDTADGDLKIKFGDGTVKTIVVDT